CFFDIVPKPWGCATAGNKTAASNATTTLKDPFINATPWNFSKCLYRTGYRQEEKNPANSSLIEAVCQGQKQSSSGSHRPRKCLQVTQSSDSVTRPRATAAKEVPFYLARSMLPMAASGCLVRVRATMG